MAGTYPIDTSGFLKTTKDRFANPVGGAVSDGLGSMFDELLNDMDRETLIPNIEPMIKIRAVQNFSPSQAVSFIFSLKKIVRETLSKKLEDHKIRDKPGSL